MLLPSENCELYCEPQLDTVYASGQPVYYSLDYSGHGRSLIVSEPRPIFNSSAINGKAGVFWDGSMNPLYNNSVFEICCGWIVAKYNAATFPSGDNGYKGLLSDLNNFPILIGNANTASFFDFSYDAFMYEYRLNDKIYSRASNGAFSAPAPMNAHKIIFFRFWKPVVLNGIQIGQQTGFTNRNWSGEYTLLALYSRNFHESEIRQYSKILADNFGQTLADVYPYQADIDNTPERPAQSVNFYDPPEGDRISEVITPSKKIIELKFSGADQAEVKAMKEYHAEHYTSASPCIYRDYRFTPPEDLEGYIDSPYDLDGSNNDFAYSFRFKEK